VYVWANINWCKSLYIYFYGSLGGSLFILSANYYLTDAVIFVVIEACKFVDQCWNQIEEISYWEILWYWENIRDAYVIEKLSLRNVLSRPEYNCDSWNIWETP
jgi:hypothetical protein